MGSCNFSRIDNKTFYVELDNEELDSTQQKYTENPVITFLAVNYNLMLTISSRIKNYLTISFVNFCGFKQKFLSNLYKDQPH